ncbi:unnamed protein product [Bemisia tabaci]|uniref:Uncharacterized protein n=1 Tax=Bemisia tabaci TaxID=7038 RepID=A0A9P0F041_BEMTA|nr:unnamed protein product [Bemisia tabaci]
MESGSADRKYFPKYADQHPIGGVGRHAAPNSIARLFNTHSARFSRYAENFIHDRLKYMQHRKMLGKRPRQKRAAVYLNHKEAASNEAYFPIWVGHRFSTSITSFPHQNQSISPDKPDFLRHSRLPNYKQPLSSDKPEFSRYHPRFPPYTQSMSPDKPEFSRHHPRFPHYEESISPDKLEFSRHNPRFPHYEESISPISLSSHVTIQDSLITRNLYLPISRSSHVTIQDSSLRGICISR